MIYAVAIVGMIIGLAIVFFADRAERQAIADMERRRFLYEHQRMNSNISPRLPITKRLLSGRTAIKTKYGWRAIEPPR